MGRIRLLALVAFSACLPVERLSAQAALTPVFLVNQNEIGYQAPSAVASDRRGRVLVDYQDSASYPYDQTGRFLEPATIRWVRSFRSARETGRRGILRFSRSPTEVGSSPRTPRPPMLLQGRCCSSSTRMGRRGGPLIGLTGPGMIGGASSAAVQAGGELVVSFTAHPIGIGDDPTEVYFRRMSASGAFLTDAIQVSQTPPTEESFNTRIAVGSSGRSLVVWGGRAPATELDIHGRVVDAEGAPVSPAFELGTDPAGWQQVPQVVSLGDGTFVALWEGDSVASSHYDVIYRLFSADGTPLTGETPVSTSPTGARYYGSLASDGGNRFVAAWTSEGQEGLPPEIYFREYRSDGSPVGPEIRASAGADREIWDDTIPFVTISPAGTITLAWTAGNYDLYERGVAARKYFRGCAEGAPRLKLGGGRFEVCTIWTSYSGERGAGVPVPLTADSGGFWFFGEDNLEVVVKILDGCGINERFWLYSAGLTDVEVTLGVIDTWTGQTWVRDTDLASPYPPIQDVEALPVCDGTAPAASATAGSARESTGVARARRLGVARDRDAPEPTSTCAPDEHHACLQGNRFRVSASYDTAIGLAGQATVVPLTAESAAFWFFGASNLELFVKVLDGCDPYGTFWVYTAGLTNVSVRLTVEDTESDEVRIYDNALGHPFTPILDAAAFATCP